MPSRPISIYHTWVPWPRPTGPEAYRVPKEARPICKHSITAVWRQLGREDEDAERAETRKRVEGELERARKSIETFNKFHSEITKFWSVVSQRVLGHVFHSPPLSVSTGPKLFTEDWALIELHAEKINWNRFKGNVVDLGTFQSVSLRSSTIHLFGYRR